jgi:hypothetical protein
VLDFRIKGSSIFFESQSIINFSLSIAVGNVSLESQSIVGFCFRIAVGDIAFQSQSIVATGISNTFLVTGQLNLKNVRQPVSFTVVVGNLAVLNTSATLVLDRLAFGIGQQSDPQAAWVSKEIGLQIGVKAGVKP